MLRNIGHLVTIAVSDAMVIDIEAFFDFSVSVQLKSDTDGEMFRRSS